MEAATHGFRADYTGLALRTRSRRHVEAGCHTPGCWQHAVEGKRFCEACQATLDRVRSELKAGSPRGRKPSVRRPAVRKAA